jgi:hypothetical protein
MYRLSPRSNIWSGPAFAIGILLVRRSFVNGCTDLFAYEDSSGFSEVTEFPPVAEPPVAGPPLK